jgi:hypothetical protein
MFSITLERHMGLFRSNTDVPPICGVVRRNGNEVTIEGPVEFSLGDYSPGAPDDTDSRAGAVSPEDQQWYLDQMNDWWTRPLGRYSVRTRMFPGPSGLRAYVGNPRGGGGRADLGGPRMWLAPRLPPGTDPAYIASASRVVGHELGHAMGNDHVNADKERSIMNPGAGGPPSEADILTLLKICGLADGGLR